MTYSATVYYKREHGMSPLIVSASDEMDAVFKRFLTEPFENSVAVMSVRERPTLDGGFPDHVLNVGVHVESKVGSLLYNGDGRVWVSKGSPSRRERVFYNYQDHEMDFPHDSEIPLNDIRVALREFLESGGHRPNSVAWHEWPEGRVVG